LGISVIRHSRSGFLGDGISSSTTSIRVERLKVAADRLQLFRRQLASVKHRLSGHDVTLTEPGEPGSNAGHGREV
jgi:hypothetical protein